MTGMFLHVMTLKQSAEARSLQSNEAGVRLDPQRCQYTHATHAMRKPGAVDR